MGRKKTHGEYVAEVKAMNPNIEVVGIYVGSNIKILHRCLIDGYEWMASPSKILIGQGCPKCAGNNRKTHEEYVNELSIKNPYVEVIEDYIGANVKIKHKCLLHNIIWEISPACALRGQGCQECLKEKIHQKNGKSHEQYVNEVEIINPYIEVLGIYVNNRTAIPHKCLIHNVTWDAQPVSVLRGAGCYECGTEKLKAQLSKTNEQYIKELELVNSNIVAVEEYQGANTAILHKCLMDGYEWNAQPSNTLSGKGCPMCAGNKKKTHEDYVNELSIVNPNIEPVEEYIGANKPILHRCLIDGYEWNPTPSDALQGKGCPKCNASKGEREIGLWLDKHNLIYETQYRFEDCRDNKPLPFDFYLPDKNTAIEYDGEQHYRSVDYFGGQEAFEKTIKHDKIKNEYCKNNGISLLRIPYFKNVEEELNNFLFI